jgi:hypothetical protein
MLFSYTYSQLTQVWLKYDLDSWKDGQTVKHLTTVLIKVSDAIWSK